MGNPHIFKGVYESKTVTDTASVILSARGNRRFLLIQNVGSVDIYIKFGAPAVADETSLLFLANGVGVMMQDTIVESEYISAVTATGTGYLVVGQG